MAIKSIDYERCTGCGLCYEICPCDVLGVFGRRVYIKYPEDCQCCNLCNVVCAVDACQVDDVRPTPLPPSKRLTEEAK